MLQSCYGSLRRLRLEAKQASHDYLLGPRLLVCAAVLAAGAAAVAVCRIHWVLLAVISGMGFCLGVLSGRKISTVVLALLPVLFYFYSFVRMPQPPANDLSRWLEKPNVIFTARVAEVNVKGGADVSDVTESADGMSGKTPSCLGQSGISAREVAGKRGVIAGNSRGGAGGFCQLIVRPESMLFPERRSLEGQTEVITYGAETNLAEGALVRIRGQLHPLRAPEYPWQPDYSARLRRRGIFCSCNASQIYAINTLDGRGSSDGPESKSSAGWVAGASAVIDSVRLRMAAVHRKYIGRDEGDLLSSMVLGDRAVELSGELRHKFRDVGLSHILAASGFNLSLVSGVTWWLARLVVPCNWLVNLLCFFSMLGYVCLAGPSPSVMRAAIMISLMLLSRCFFRKLHLPAALSVALLLNLLVEPFSVTDVGLQLSYAATASIIFGAKPLASLFRSLPPGRWPGWLCDSIAVVLLAQAGVLPIQLGCFWQIGLFFLPANLLVAPLISPITILGFASSTLVVTEMSKHILEPVAAVLDMLADIPLKLLLAVVNLFAGLDFARLCLGPPPMLAVVVYCMALALLLSSLAACRFRRAATLLFAVATVGLLWRMPLQETTIACLRHSVAIIQPSRTAVAVGNATSPEVTRFLAFHGISASRVRFINAAGAAEPLAVALASGKRVLIIQPSASLKPDYTPQPAQLSIVKDLNGSGSLQGSVNLNDGHADMLSGLIKRSGCTTVVLDYSLRSERAFMRALEWRLKASSVVTIVRQQYNEVVLTDAPVIGVKYKDAIISVRN